MCPLVLCFFSFSSSSAEYPFTTVCTYRLCFDQQRDSLRCFELSTKLLLFHPLIFQLNTFKHYSKASVIDWNWQSSNQDSRT